MQSREGPSSGEAAPVKVDVEMQEAVKMTGPATNPVSRTATLSFAVNRRAETMIVLYNTLGQRVATVYVGTPHAGEQQRVQIDATGFPSSVYFLRLRAGGRTRTQRLTIVH